MQWSIGKVGEVSAMSVPRGLSLFAALAVSGTALYLVYGYKKTYFLDIRRGKGSLRVEYRPVQTLNNESTLSRDLTEGKETGIVDLRCQRRSKRQQPIILLHGPMPGQEVLREKLAKCSTDANLVKSLHTTLTSYKITDQQDEGFEISNHNASGHPSRLFENFDRGDISSAPCLGCKERLEGNKRSVGYSLVPSCSLPFDGEDCSLKSSSSPSPPSEGDDHISKSSLPPPSPFDGDNCTSKSTSSPSRPVLVGCFTSSGTKEAGKLKKVVRFSSTVVEPSSNNDEYRRRCKSVTTHRTRTQVLPSEALRSIAFDRPKLYSQAAKHTITYNIHRTDSHYNSRSYY